MAKTKACVVALYILSVFCFFAPVAWIVAEKFPLWRTQGGGGLAIGSGVIIVGVVVFMTFKRYITAFVSEKLGTLGAGVTLIFIWFSLAFALSFIASLATMLNDLATVFLWAGFGAVGGVALQVWARRLSKKIKEASTDGNSDQN